MNRETKYRAYHKNLKIEVDVLLIDWLNELVDLEGGLIEQEFGDVVLIRYTGLKDKYGVEIYEGDIVERTHLFNGGYGETHTGEVVYDKEYARYVISRPNKHIEPKTEDLRNTLSDKSTYVVIGNIYENPELLEREGK